MSVADLDLGKITAAPFFECEECGACKHRKGDFMRGWRVELERAGKTLKFNLCSAEKLDGRPADTTIRNYRGSCSRCRDDTTITYTTVLRGPRSQRRWRCCTSGPGGCSALRSVL